MTVLTPPRTLRIVGASCALVVALTSAGGPAAGAEDDQLAVNPASEGSAVRPVFNYQVERGSVVDDAITLTNLGDEEVRVELYAVDAAVTTDGSFAPTRRDDTHTGVGAWVELDAPQAILAPGTEVDVGFRFAVPDLTEPGDYAGVIVAQAEGGEELVGDGEVRLAVERGVGVRLFARVAGTLRPDLAVSGVRIVPENPVARWFGFSVPARLEYTITNTGNIRIVPIASAEVEGLLGTNRRTVPERTLPDLLPGGSVTVSDDLGDIAPSLLLRADVEVRSPDGSVTAASTGRRVLVPWAALVVFVLALWWLWRQLGRLRRYRRERGESADWELTR